VTLDLLLGDFPEPICKFVGDWRFLSNFYDRPLIFDGIAYRSSEAAYQAQKDPAIAKEFADLSPTDAKALGRWVTPRADWNEARVEVMRRVLRAKFDQNLDLWAKLVATAPRRLIEGNTWGDTFWGRCRGKGENWLGKLLMELRDHYLIPPPIPPPTPPILTVEDLMTDDLKLVTVPSADPEEAPPVPKDDRHLDRQALKDRIFCHVAETVAELATCCRLKVGCFLLTKEGRLCGQGYNGAGPGMPHCDPAHCNANCRCRRTRHAEKNALSNRAGTPYTAYLTHEPCCDCAKDLIAEGVRRVVYVNSYNSMPPEEWAARQEWIDFYQVRWEQLPKPLEGDQPS
jgi:ribA/ribD-fused uncharacterized protein